MTGPRLFGEGGLSGPELLLRHGPRVTVLVRRPGGPVEGAASFLECEALIDTGASHVCISRAIARDLNLTPTDHTVMGVVGGTVDATVFAGELVVPELDFCKTMAMYSPRVIAPHAQILLG